jgi:iron-sulfur cluster assembly protein
MKDLIILTEKASEQIRSLQANPLAAGKALRVFVQEGGCCGASFGMTFDDKQELDAEVEQHGVKIVLDPSSVDQLQGSVIDYIEDERGTGFEVCTPKKAGQHGGCGCSH